MKAVILVLCLALAGCATSANIADGIQVGVSARPEAVGVDVSINPFDAGCTFAKAVSWNWAENQFCEPEVSLPENN